MMQAIESLVSTLSGWVWGPPMLTLLVGTGLYLTILLKGMQFRVLPHAFRLIFHKDHSHAGDISHFAALMTALAATVGIGNIVGVATAITLGGPGAVFWMWMTGLVGMATKYAEAVLAVKYREHGEHGMRGGPMYYLAKGAKLPTLGWFFALFTALAAFGIGNMTQANAVAGIFESTFNIEPWVTGVVLMLLTGLVILGGIRSIGRFTSLLVPFMIIGYVGTALVVLVVNASEIPHALWLIFHHAFNPIAAGGGFAGAAVAAAIRYGVARGVFSNESGLGSAPIAAAAARTKDPVTQALVSMTQTFIDTLVVCSMTALVILTATPWTEGVGAGQLTSLSFAQTLGPSGEIIVAIAT
nr:sodium:alanine symporter family protein [Halioglobus sp.]